MIVCEKYLVSLLTVYCINAARNSCAAYLHMMSMCSCVLAFITFCALVLPKYVFGTVFLIKRPALRAVLPASIIHRQEANSHY